jgi:hypothetical protein
MVCNGESAAHQQGSLVSRMPQVKSGPQEEQVAMPGQTVENEGRIVAAGWNDSRNGLCSEQDDGADWTTTGARKTPYSRYLRIAARNAFSCAPKRVQASQADRCSRSAARWASVSFCSMDWEISRLASLQVNLSMCGCNQPVVSARANQFCSRHLRSNIRAR